MSDVTRVLSQIEQGDPQAAEKLLPLVYDELRKLAAAKLAHERPGQTLQATALVHEAYLRLAGNYSAGQHWNSRGHFFAAAAEAMRRILIDRARASGSVRRGGSRQRVELTDVPQTGEALRVDDLIDLDAALQKLAAVDPIAAKLVELRVFAGQSLSESAAILNLPPSTTKRTWNYARAWLRREVSGEGAQSGNT